MKKNLQVLLCLLLVGTLNAQTPSNLWTPQAIGLLPKGHSIVGISVVNKDIVWAIADSVYSNPMPSTHRMKILKTTNGGTTWQVYAVAEAQERFGVYIHAFDANNAWISAQKIGSSTGHGVYKTTDGGTTWTQYFNDYSASYLLHFFDAQNGIIWNRHAISRTQNGGLNWTPSTVTGYLSGEGFATSSATNAWSIIGDSIWAGTTRSRVAFSANRGVTWSFQDLRAVSFFGDQVWIPSIAFKDTRNGIAMGWNSNNFQSYLAKTTDGGTTWAQVATYPFTIGSAIEYVKGTKDTYMVGDFDGLTAYTTNAGQSWVKIDSLDVNAIGFLNPQTGWAGRDLTLENGVAMYKWNESSILTAIKVLEPEEIGLKISPNPTSRFLKVDHAPTFQATELLIFDPSGRTVFTKKNNTGFSQIIDLQSLESGVYFIQLENTEGVVAVQKVVKQ